MTTKTSTQTNRSGRKAASDRTRSSRKDKGRQNGTSPDGNDGRQDLYARVTDRIIAELEQGVRPWLKPWDAGRVSGAVSRPLRHNGTPYSGINILLLWSESVARGFASPYWMTFRQAEELGGHVRKGETGSLVVYAGRIRKHGEDRVGEETVADTTGAVEDDKVREIRFLKGYTVFNVEQIDGLPERYTTSPAPVARIETAERFLLNCGAAVGHGGDRAWYSPAADCIQLPPFASFRDAESYYATFAHELTHWTGHSSRLDRALAQKQDRDAYAREELVAELWSAFLSADLGLTPEPCPDHAAYLSYWLTLLRADKRAIFRAAAEAQRAADYLHGLQSGAAGSADQDGTDE